MFFLYEYKCNMYIFFRYNYNILLLMRKIIQ